MTKAKKVLLVVLAIILLLIAFCGIYDYRRISSFEKPIFTLSQTADDGGSGDYYGIFYSVNLSGELRDGSYYISQYVYSILGIEIANITRH